MLLDSDMKKYIEFYEQFGIPLKEGLYQDFENKDALLDLMCFKTNQSDDYISLETYVKNMQKDQKSIFFLTGAKLAELKNSPLLEVCNNKNIEVLLMDHEIDEMVFGAMQKYKDHDFKSINHANSLEEIQGEEKEPNKASNLDPFIKKVKKYWEIK